MNFPSLYFWDASYALSYFHPSTSRQSTQCTSATVWRPVMRCRSSFGPTVMFIAWEKRKARPCLPYWENLTQKQYWTMYEGQSFRKAFQSSSLIRSFSKIMLTTRITIRLKTIQTSSNPFLIGLSSGRLATLFELMISRSEIKNKTKGLDLILITWKALEMISSWKATWFLQLQQLYKRGPNSSAIDHQAERAPDTSPPKESSSPTQVNKNKTRTPIEENQGFPSRNHKRWIWSKAKEG